LIPFLQDPCTSVSSGIGGYKCLKSLLSHFGRPRNNSCALRRLLSHPMTVALPFLLPCLAPPSLRGFTSLLLPYPYPALAAGGYSLQGCAQRE